MARIRGGPTNAPYVASKHAVVGLTRCAAQLDPDDPRGVSERVAASVPLGKRYGTADEVANLAVWLLSDEASYVSGSTHLIDAAVNA
jgi:3alpha(or 20beta)-hydroxysteroid dehydrogenase